MGKSRSGVDIAKYVASLCIVAAHVYITSPITNSVSLFLVNSVFRLIVPFFFCCTGYFLEQKGITNRDVVFPYVKKLLKTYFIWSLVYIPMEILKMAGTNTLNAYNIIEYLHMCVVQGTFVHLWYFPATIFAVLLLHFMLKKMSIKGVFCIAVLLYFVGMLGETYAGIMPALPQWANALMDTYKIIFLDTRNGLFFGMPFVLMGVVVFKYQDTLKKITPLPWLLISTVFVCLETYFLGKFSLALDYNTMFFVLPATLFLFCVALFAPGTKNNYLKLRSLSSLIYGFHLIPYGILLAILNFINVPVLKPKIVQLVIVLICSNLFALWMTRKKRERFR